MEKTDGESYLHAAAKETVISWLRGAKRDSDGRRQKFGLSFDPFDQIGLNGVYAEYPLTFDMMSNGRSWLDYPGWWCECQEMDGYECGCEKPNMRDWPDYEWMIQNRPKWETENDPKRLAQFGKDFIIADIAVMDRTSIKYVIEIVHTSSASLSKLVMIDSAGDSAPQMIFLNASWVMGLRREPELLQAYFIGDMERLAIKSQFGDAARSMVNFPHGFHTRANDYPIYGLVEHTPTPREAAEAKGEE